MIFEVSSIREYISKILGSAFEESLCQQCEQSPIISNPFQNAFKSAWAVKNNHLPVASLISTFPLEVSSQQFPRCQTSKIWYLIKNQFVSHPFKKYIDFPKE